MIKTVRQEAYTKHTTLKDSLKATSNLRRRTPMISSGIQYANAKRVEYSKRPVTKTQMHEALLKAHSKWTDSKNLKRT